MVHVQPRYDSDPYPFDQATDFARTEAKNWTMGDRWNSHFVQGTCESDLALRSVCASLFACFVYFDMVETLHMIEWLYWVPRGTADMAAPADLVVLPRQPQGARTAESV